MVFQLYSATRNVASAKNGNTAHAIDLLKELNRSLKGESELEESIKKYFIECLDHLLSNIDPSLTDQQIQTLAARSLNLVKKKGQKEPTSKFLEIMDAVYIHNLKVKNQDMNIDEIVMQFMSTNEKYSKQYEGGKTDSLVKKYRAYKKTFGWDDLQIISFGEPE